MDFGELLELVNTWELGKVVLGVDVEVTAHYLWVDGVRIRVKL